MHRGVDRGSHQPTLGEVPDVQLDVSTLISYQRIGPLTSHQPNQCRSCYVYKLPFPRDGSLPFGLHRGRGSV
jgi:hypothetical protein